MCLFVESNLNLGMNFNLSNFAVGSITGGVFTGFARWWTKQVSELWRWPALVVERHVVVGV